MMSRISFVSGMYQKSLILLIKEVSHRYARMINTNIAIGLSSIGML